MRCGKCERRFMCVASRAATTKDWLVCLVWLVYASCCGLRSLDHPALKAKPAPCRKLLPDEVLLPHDLICVVNHRKGISIRRFKHVPCPVEIAHPVREQKHLFRRLHIVSPFLTFTLSKKQPQQTSCPPILPSVQAGVCSLSALSFQVIPVAQAAQFLLARKTFLITTQRLFFNHAVATELKSPRLEAASPTSTALNIATSPSRV
jgi:hypothetical protein